MPARRPDAQEPLWAAVNNSGLSRGQGGHCGDGLIMRLQRRKAVFDMKRRDFSSRWLLCIVWLAVFAPGAGAEQNSPVTFQIQVSQPEYERTGGVWTCGAAQLFREQCRGTVPLVMFGEPMSATIQISIVPYDLELHRDQKSVKLRASLSGVRAKYKPSDRSGPIKYKASDRRRPMMLENDGSFAREIRLDQADDVVMFPVVRPTPQESFGLIIKRISPGKDHK